MLVSTNLAAQMRIRKQVYDLKSADLEKYPVWEFALDEEGTEGQDEATVRPKPGVTEISDFTGQLVVRAEFIAADGTAFIGAITPNKTMDLGYIHPVIIAQDKQIMFWHGAMKPKPSDLEASYKILRKTPKQLFPLKFRSLISLKGGINAGIIPGFLYLKDFKNLDTAKPTIIK